MRAHTDDTSTRRWWRIVTIIAIGVIAALVAVAYRFGEYWLRTVVFDAVKASTPAWALFLWPILGTIAAGAVALTYATSYTDKISWAKADEQDAMLRRRTQLIVAGVVLTAFGVINLAVPGLGLFGSQAWRNGHESRLEIAAQVTDSTDPHPEYLPRPNSVQANRLVNELLNDVSISSTTPVQYSVANGAPAWCAGGEGRADRFGRKYTTRVLCIDDAGRFVKAFFTGTVPSIGGSFSTNLSKRIAEARPGTSIAAEDVRFAIVDGNPLLIASGTFRRGGMHPITLPAGVFTYDTAGRLTYDDHATAGEYGVAVLPYTVARSLRESLNDRGGYWCLNNLNKAKCLERNTPYETTNAVNGDAVSDVNSENFSEFVLRRVDGSIAMVTPLTNYGKGRNITAYLDVAADEVRAGTLPTAVLYGGVNEVSHRVVVQALTPAYTSDLTWLTEIDANADQATASRIFEITPTKPGAMRLTIGTATNPQYVVDVEATLQTDSLEFRWCIYTDGSRGQTSKLIECRGASDGEAAIGTLRGINLTTTTPDTGDSPTTGEIPADLAGLSDQALLDLIKAASEELARR